MLQPDEFALTLVDPIEALCEAWAQHFDGLPRISIVNGFFEDVESYDCMVSAANSFGLMDGGVDLAITHYFGHQLMARVQQRILSEFRGEQPVGTAFIAETGHTEHPYLAHAPTMRTPMEIATTDNVYLAMWAVLLAVWRHNRTADRPIRTLLCPGLGTATGQVPFNEAARQMALAYKHFLKPPSQIDWPYAQLRQKAIGRGGDHCRHAR